MKMKKITAFLFMGVLMMMLLAGCGDAKSSAEKLRDVEFTVISQEDVPEEMAKTIAEEGEEPFQITYQLENYLYIAKGYGAQETSGYSISVNGLYLTQDNLVLQTELTGPGEGQKVQQTKTCPYVVVKTEYMDKGVVFQ